MIYLLFLIPVSVPSYELYFKKECYTDLEHELVYYVGAGLGNKPPPPVAG